MSDKAPLLSAADLMTEWLATSRRSERVSVSVAWNRYGQVLRRLVEAEQALADIENLCEDGDRGMIEAQRQVGHVGEDVAGIVLTRHLRAALRASQGGQTPERCPGCDGIKAPTGKCSAGCGWGV